MSERTPAEQNAVDRRRELIAEALDRAASGGVFLNAQGKSAPMLYKSTSGSSISAFNALTLALHSDRGGFRTNLYTPFTEAKKRGESVQAGEKGVPFVWYKWNAFRDRTDKDRTISRQEYNALSEEQKKGFAPVREKEIRTLFNIEQTSLPLSDKAAFEKAMKENGPVSERGESEQDDKKLRMEVNDFLKAVGENLSPIRKDGIGIAHYDSEKDIIHLPSQKHYDTYPEYVQDAVRQIVTATGHPGRLGRPGAVEGGYAPTEAQSLRERLVVELASAVKMNQLGLPARIADENIPLIDKWKESMEKNPRLMDGLEAEVNNALAMLYKAEHGVKIEKTNEPARQEAQADRISAKLLMVQDDEGKWAMYVKPENEKGFAIYPESGDIGRFFAASKMDDAVRNRIKSQLVQKYYDLAAKDPGLKVDLFTTKEKDIDLAQIKSVSVLKTKENKLICSPVIEGIGKPEPREVSQSQWQRLWMAEDKVEYKRNLAATLFADVIRQQQKQAETEKQQEEKRMNSPEQKAKEEREEKAKEALTKAETGAVVGIIAGAVAKQEEEEQHRGFHR
ncbi:MAG: DUF1738 domain-containing protein [Bacteroidales bacterium]|nr:DUF1738 domain-containing protein [Bacteroidales bacterium]